MAKKKINSNRKGKVGELEVAHLLKGMGYEECRRGQQFKGTEDSPDVFGLPGVHIEVKRREENLKEIWLKQAVKECGSLVPCVVHRMSREDWKLTIRLEDLNRLVEALQKKEP